MSFAPGSPCGGRRQIALALLSLLFVVCPYVLYAAGQAQTQPTPWSGGPLTCWRVDRTEHPLLTVKNESPLTIVAARATRKLGVNRCRYLPGDSLATRPPAETAESVRQFYVELTVRNNTSATIPADSDCNFYDTKGAEVVFQNSPLISAEFDTSLKPGQTVHFLTCDFDPQKFMSQGFPIPNTWQRVYHTILRIFVSYKG